MSNQVSCDNVRVATPDELGDEYDKPIRFSGNVLEVTLVSDDRESLDEYGRKVCMDVVKEDPKYATFASAGVEKTSGPMAFDPAQPDLDPYAIENKEGITWRYRQHFRLTKML